MRIPRKLGRYEVLFPIASGGMADVFCARMTGVGGFTRLVALKRVRTDQRGDADAVTAILDEARLASQIGSAHVVDVLDVGRGKDGAPYLVMELIVGVTLSDILMSLAEDGSTLEPELAVDILIQLAMGLDDAHQTRGLDGESLQIVHRDVSPQNALVGIDGVARITDFGIAQFTKRKKETTAHGEIRGKAGYLTPEVVKGQAATALSDQFSLAVVGWELLTTERLFKGANPLMTMKRVASMKAPRLDEIRPEIPASIADVIARALDKVPERRFESLGAMADALREAAAEAYQPVARDSLGEMARVYGGESLAKVERGIRVAAGQAPTDIIHLTSSKETRTAVLLAPDDRASRPPPSGAPSARARSRAPWVVTGLVVSAVAAAGLWWVRRAPDPTPPAAAAPRIEEPAEEPVEDPLPPVDWPQVAEAPPLPPPLEPPPEPDVDGELEAPSPPSAARRRRTRREPPADPPPADDPALGVGGLLGSEAFR